MVCEPRWIQLGVLAFDLSNGPNNLQLHHYLPELALSRPNDVEFHVEVGLDIEGS